MLKLDKTTLIIPIKVEHPDRMRNARTTLGFLNANLKTNVFIYEVSSNGESNLGFISSLSNLNIKHWCFREDDVFHRTKYLNYMLDQVETPVVSNYDIDVILRPENYLHSQERILSGEADVIYPYKRSSDGQFQVHQNFNYEGFERSGFDITFMQSAVNLTLYEAECGHCMFFNTDVYRNLGGENEGFISYGPEDKERMIRFQMLTNNRVEWSGSERVFHFEHFRSPDSSGGNPFFHRNWEVLNGIMKMSQEELSQYYQNRGYLSNYKNIGAKR
jgi:predicted glycosyltransferase involved in capsule biosynthesis